MRFSKYIPAFALFSICVAILHFFVETWYHFRFGQSLIQLLADYIAIGLLLFGGLVVRKRRSGLGLLCGAWGFTFCLNYRAFAWRMDEMMRGTSTLLIDNTLKVLASLLIFSFLAFLLTLYWSYPRE